MHNRMKASLVILAAIGAVSSVQFLSSSARAQQPPPNQGGGFGGGQGPGGPRRMMANNMTAKVTITDAIKAAKANNPGYVNSATLRRLPPNGGQGGPPPNGQAGPPNLIWVIHIVTEPGTPGPNGSPGKGQDVAVDAASNQVVALPPPPPPRGGGRGGNGGPPPPPPPPGGAN